MAGQVEVEDAVRSLDHVRARAFLGLAHHVDDDGEHRVLASRCGVGRDGVRLHELRVGAGPDVGAEECLVEPNAIGEGGAAGDVQRDVALVAVGDKVAAVLEGARVVAVVVGKQGERSQQGQLVVGGHSMVAQGPARVVVARLDLWQRVDGLPLERGEVRKIERRRVVLDRPFQNALFCRGAQPVPVDGDGLYRVRRVEDQLDVGSGIEVAGQLQLGARGLGCAHQVAGLHDDILLARVRVGADRRRSRQLESPVLVGVVAPQQVDDQVAAEGDTLGRLRRAPPDRPGLRVHLGHLRGGARARRVGSSPLPASGGRLDGEFVGFTFCGVHDEDSFARRAAAPAEYVGRRVQQAVFADRVVGDHHLRVATDQGQLATELRDRHVARRRCERDLVVHGTCRVPVRLAHNIEVRVRLLAEKRRCRDGVGVGVDAGGDVARRGGEVTGRDLEEVGLEFLGAVLLSDHLPVLVNGGAVVVRRVTAIVAEIAPVGAAVGHVQVEPLDAEGEVVLVEDAHGVRSHHGVALVLRHVAPAFHGTALELEDGEGRRGAPRFLVDLPLCRQRGGTPAERVGAVEPERVGVDSVNVDGAQAGAGRPEAVLGVVVEGERHDDSGSTQLTFQERHILAVELGWEVGDAGPAGIFVLDLGQDDGAAVGDLVLRDDAANRCHVILGGILPLGAVAAEPASNEQRPGRDAAGGDLGVDVRSRAREEVEAGVGGGLEERLDVKDAVESHIAGLRLYQGPVDVESDGVEAQRLDLLEDVNPEVGDGQAEGVEGAGEEEHALPVDEVGLSIVGHDVLQVLPPDHWVPLVGEVEARWGRLDWGG